MADQSTQSIVMAATPAEIMAVLADFPRYTEWVGAPNTNEVLEPHPYGRPKQVRWVIDAGSMKDEYVLEYRWSGVEKVEWDLVRGQLQKSQHGSYELAPDGTSTRVTYSLTVELNVPMLGLFKRKAEKVIMDTALKELKRRVES